MAKSNWKGTSGWAAVNDPTASLRGRVLFASAGITATNEDYLTTLVGTSTAFSADHYSVLTDYAFPSTGSAHPLSAGSLGLISRSGNFQGNPERAYDCYLGELNVEEKKCKIIRRNGNKDTVLMSSDMPNSAIARGKKHTMEFRCYGSNYTTLQLLIDTQMVANVSDTASNKLSSGFSGIHVRNGAAYLDTFTVVKYTEGGNAPEIWTPMQITGLTLSAWYIASKGISKTGDRVDEWSDQSINNNTLIDVGSPLLLENDINNYDAISFNGVDEAMGHPHNVDHDMNADGLSLFIIAKVKDFTGGGSLISKGNSYEFKTDSSNSYKFIGDPSNSEEPTTFVGVTNTYQLVGVITDKDDDTGLGAIWIDGVSSVGVTFGAGADNTNSLFVGKNNDSTPRFFNGEIAEIVLIKGECDKEKRQLVEGYLANKYATASRLPNNHPYKNFAPIQ